MAQAGSWPAIRDHGLLSTNHIVESAGIHPNEVDRLLRNRRPQSVVMDHPVLGAVVIRDQGPLNLSHLRLTDQTVEEWLSELNSRVFFWLRSEKLSQLLNARRYRSFEQDVLTIDTQSLLQDVGARAQLSPVNSGATLYPSAPPRGSHTFTPIDEYDYTTQRRRRGRLDAIVELAVIGGVVNIRDHVIEVRRMRGDTVIETY